jgi:hypothetical protein
MSQSRLLSAVESGANVAVGYVVALLSQLAVFPMFGIQVPFSTNLWIGAWFTVISLVRSYVLRRWFNGLRFQTAPAQLAAPLDTTSPDKGNPFPSLPQGGAE